MLAWPAERTNRSRSGQSGWLGAWRRKRVHATYAIGAAPIGAPGWPEFACCTASIDSVRIVSMARRSSPFSAIVMRAAPDNGRSRRRHVASAASRAGTLPGMSPRLRSRRPPSFVVVGDLMLDVVITPDRPVVPATDVPGTVRLRQGGSAANTARWLVRLGAPSRLVTAVGRDPIGRALVRELRSDGVRVHAARVAGRPTGRVAVLVGPGGDRSFVADRGAADALAAGDLRAGWFERAEALHLPVYSLLGRPLGEAGHLAVDLMRRAGGQVSIDLASIGPLLAGGHEAARALIADIAPDILFATGDEADALLAGHSLEELLEVAPVVVVKRGAQGATALARVTGAAERAGHDLRFEVATRPVVASDTTGAGDAFDAGFSVAWREAGSARRSTPEALQRATIAGHRAAARHITTVRSEISLR